VCKQLSGLLAHADNAVQNEACAGPLRAYTPATAAHGAALRQTLAKVRRDGYAVTHRTLEPDCGAIAFPVRGADGDVVAAVGVVVHTDTFHPSKLAPLVSAAADAVSQSARTLGWRALRPGP